MITETIISAALLANFITWYFSPLDTIREWIVDMYIRFCVKYNMFWATSGIQIITCPKCLAFWGTLIYTWNLVDAILASMLALFISWMLKYISNAQS
jgi:hypothetical protein